MAHTNEHGRRTAFLRITVLVCGAIVMILELAGSRLLAPFFGNGLFVWTALIGIMLGFMSLGNYLGGWLADRRLTGDVLFWILAGSSAGVGIIAFTEPTILPLLARADSIRIAAVGASVALFGIPCTLLGMVTPFSTRYALRSLDHSGATVGSLYALGTLGSIIGTFLGGFYILAWVGSHSVIAWLALVLLLLSVSFASLHWSRFAMFAATGILIVLAMSADASAVESFDTSYDRYIIAEEADPKTGRPVTILARDHDSMESAVYADTGEPYLFDYYEYYDLALEAAASKEPLERTLLIGGGTFSFPRHQLAEFPDSEADVVEIDPALVDVAKKRFFLVDDPRLHIHEEDGRTFLNRMTNVGGKGRYDVVLIDAFKSANSIPYQLTTRESIKMCYDLLDDDGILVMNIIASPGGAGSRFLAAQFRTIQSVFPQAQLYAVYDTSYSETAQNISIIATRQPVSETDLERVLGELSTELTARKLDPEKLPKDVRVLTDDFAPVDQYLMDI